MTSSDQGKCGLTSLLPMSCRGRAEAFARRLQSRLNSLGSQNGSTSPPPSTTATTKEIVDETSWLTAKRSDNNIALSQPRTSTDTELFFDLNLLESPGSPVDEVDNITDHNRLEKLLNHDNLQLPHNEDCHCLGNEKNYKKLIDTNSVNDSDSSDIFYDTENEVPTNNSENTNGIDCYDDNDDVFVTTSECTRQPSASLSNDDSSSLHTNESLSDLPQDTETYTNRLTVDKDMMIECPNVEITDTSPTSIINNNNNQDDSGNGEDYDDDDDDENEMRLPRVRRCSSLKTGKTPPGTPGRKKIVRFADVLGLDLADVRTFLDEIPKIPISAYDDLKDVELSNDNDQVVNNITNNKVDRILMPLFQQPGGLPNFLDRIRDNCVCLESAMVKDPIELSISGTVRVRNLDFHKSVHIRYTLDSWQSFADVKANYVENSCDGFSDKFTFLMYANTLSIGQRLEFAVRFQCKGCQYWDNNNGVNYCFQCLPSTNTTNCFRPITSRLDDGWSAGFYYGDDDGDDTDEINKEPDELVTSKAVQEFILNTLETKSSSVKQPTRAMKKKSDILTLFIIMIISIIFMYLQKAIS